MQLAGGVFGARGLPGLRTVNLRRNVIVIRKGSGVDDAQQAGQPLHNNEDEFLKLLLLAREGGQSWVSCQPIMRMKFKSTYFRSTFCEGWRLTTHCEGWHLTRDGLLKS